MKRLSGVLLLLWLSGLALPAWAQRADDNAIADAEDAFGSNDGGEDLGLYSPYDVRGFSPFDAGNVRIEGLYMDRQADLSPRLVEGNRIRVGLTAVGYGLPAPSGIVDYRLRTPDGPAGLSAVVQANSFGGHLFELDARTPLADRLHLGGGISASRSEYASGNNADVFNAALIGAWRSSDETDVRAFWSAARMADEDIYPIVQGPGDAPPPRLVRRRFLGQDWADLETDRFNYGVLARTRLHGLSVRAGLFRSVTDVTEGHSVFLQSAPPGELAQRSVSAYPGRWSASTSGELGLARAFSAAGFEQRLSLVLRGRGQDRRYGGATRVALPPAPFGEAAPVGRPDFVFSEQSRDEVRQWSGGLTWAARRPGRGELSFGVQKVGYRKTVHAPGGPVPETRDGPWLFNAAGVLEATSWASIYAGYATGLEESEVAPQSAVNRDEAPPAIRTRQLDGGVRLALGRVTLVAGAFQIERPYFGTDAAGLFRTLGDVRHRGVELSLTGSPVEGLTVVAGGVLLDARVSGHEVEQGRVGARPVGTSPRKLIASVDWRRPGSPVSYDLAIEHFGPAWADTLNRARVESYSVVDLGARFRFRVSGRPAVLRLHATNLLNSYGWEIVGENGFVYTQPRQLLARLTLDF
jgi:iron complex outermembrane receptor protein